MRSVLGQHSMSIAKVDCQRSASREWKTGFSATLALQGEAFPLAKASKEIRKQDGYREELKKLGSS